MDEVSRESLEDVKIQGTVHKNARCSKDHESFYGNVRSV